MVPQPAGPLVAAARAGPPRTGRRRRRGGRYTAALGLYDGLASRSGEERFETACCRTALAALAGGNGAGVSPAEGKAEADQAMALLEKAVGVGFRNATVFRTEPRWARSASARSSRNCSRSSRRNLPRRRSSRGDREALVPPGSG